MKTKYARYLGTVHTSDLDENDLPVGFEDEGDVSVFKTALSVESEDVKSWQTGSVAFTDEKSRTLSGEIEFRDVSAKKMARLVRSSVVSQAAGTVTDVPVTLKPGKVIPLPHANISAVVLKDATTSDVLTAGTDYVANTKFGSLVIPATTTERQALLSYSHATGVEGVGFFTNSGKNVAVYFEGKNTAPGQSGGVRIGLYKIYITPMEEFNPLSESIITLKCKFTALLDPTKPVDAVYGQYGYCEFID
jgi:hypothetical protein